MLAHVQDTAATSDPRNPPLSADARGALRAYLDGLYRGVFSDDAIERHMDDYVGFEFVDQVAPLVARAIPPGGRVLDIGAGFGSFVLAARELGLDATGVEIAEEEVAFARRRLARVRPQDDPGSVYVQGDARTQSIPDASLDAATFWNVLEHLDDMHSILRRAARMLKPRGAVFVICPNYAAFRDEAHYNVPWYPYFPRRLASSYLRRRGRNPRYFETSVFYRTNWGVMRGLAAAGFELHDWSASHSMALTLRNVRSMARDPLGYLRYYNPLKESVVLAARKKAAS